MPATPVILVIEDQTELGEVILDVLTEEGYDVLAVRDRFAAVATLREREVDLIVADLPSPEPGTGDPLGEITRDFADTPLVVVSDEDGSAPFFGPWRRSGKRVELRRPFRLDDLLEVSEVLLEEARYDR